MGAYINAPEMGFHGKADVLIEKYGGVEVDPFEEINTKSHVKVFVVDNGAFEAAAIAYNPGQFARFTHPGDHRPVRVIKMLRIDAVKHCDPGYEECVLTGCEAWETEQARKEQASW